MKATIDLPLNAVTVVAAPPRILSRHNCAHVGMTEGEFAAAVARARAAGVPVVREGKLLLVPTEAFCAWLLRERATQSEPANDGATEAPGAPAGALTEDALDQEFRLSPATPPAKRGR